MRPQGTLSRQNDSDTFAIITSEIATYDRAGQAGGDWES